MDSLPQNRLDSKGFLVCPGQDPLDLPTLHGAHQYAFLPSYAPELQLAEHLCPLTDAPLVNQRFPDLATLETVRAQRCNSLQQQPDLIRQHTLFKWWLTNA